MILRNEAVLPATSGTRGHATLLGPSWIETTSSRPKPILDMVGQLHCPLFGVFGEEDQNPTVAQSEELKSLAQRAGKDVTNKVYKNAGHAFLADYRPSYREGPATELWGDAVSFFDKHLKS